VNLKEILQIMDKIVFHRCQDVSASGELRPQAPTGALLWTPLEDFRVPYLDPIFAPFQQKIYQIQHLRERSHDEEMEFIYGGKDLLKQVSLNPGMKEWLMTRVVNRQEKGRPDEC